MSDERTWNDKPRVHICARCCVLPTKSYMYTDEGRMHGKETHHICTLCGARAVHVTRERADQMIRAKARRDYDKRMKREQQSNQT